MGELIKADFIAYKRLKPEEIIESSASLAVSIALRGDRMIPEHLQMLKDELTSNLELLGSEEREAVEQLSRQRIDAHLGIGNVALKRVK